MEPSRPAVPELKPDEIRAELDRILSSRCFAHSGRASDFLRFVVEETLAGSGGRLKGYTIGTEVFGRPADFDPQTDPLVRVEAGRLRSRLAEYYQNEGATDPVEIELPRGRYTATWQRRQTAVPAPPSSGPPLGARRDAGPWRAGFAALALLLVAVLAGLAWHFGERHRAASPPAATTVATEAPRIIVTPFESLGLDTPQMAALAASLTEEVLLALGRQDVRVIAAEPRWLDSGRVSQVSSHDYVLSGTVRLGGNRVRIAARLIERGTGVQLWGRAYDQSRGIETAPALQTAIAQEIAAVAMPYGPIFDTELARARSGEVPLLRDCLARYLDYRRTMESEPFVEALECYQGLSLQQPASAEVWAGLAMLYLDDYGYRYGHTPTLEASLMLAREAVEQALARDRDLMLANMAVARLHLFDGQRDELRRTVDALLAREPGNAEARAYLGVTLALAGDARGIDLVDEALERSPRQPGIVNMAYAVDHLRHGRAREALEAAQRVATPNWFPGQMLLAASAGLCGDEGTAARARARVLELYPNFEAEALEIFKQWHHDEALDAALIVGLQRAGFELEAATSEAATPWPESWL